MLDFFEFSNEMLCVADSQGYFVRLNQAWTKILGWSVEELVSRPYVEFVHPDDTQATIREAELLLSGTHETISFENRYRSKDGSYRWLAWYAKLDPGSNQLVAAARDVTDQKRVEAELRSERQLLRNLIEVQENEKQFLCHDFHDGLIQYAVGSLMLLESCRRHHLPSEHLAVIDKAIDNLRQGIEDGRRTIHGIRPAVLDDGSSLQAAIEELIQHLAPSDILVTCRCDSEIGQLPEMIQTTVYRVVQEALNNARKHSGTDVVRIKVRKDGGSLHLEIQDFGRGFDVASARQRGFGLRGMSERVRLLGGECVIESQPDEGTRIVVRLPITATDRES